MITDKMVEFYEKQSIRRRVIQLLSKCNMKGAEETKEIYMYLHRNYWR